MRPVPGSANSPLRWSVKAIAFGLTSPGASAATDGTSTSANSCAPAAETHAKNPARSAIAHRGRISFSLHEMAVAPEIVRIDAARTAALVAVPQPRLPEQAAPWGLRRLAPGRVAAERPAVTFGPPAAERLAIAHDLAAATIRVGLLARDETILRILQLAAGVEAELLDESATGSGRQTLAGGKIDRQRRELASCLGGGRGERCLGCVIGPRRLDDRLED